MSELQTFWAVMLTLLVAFTGLLHLCRAFAEVRADFRDEVRRVRGTSPLRTWLVGGMMGSGKTTFAQSLASDLGLPHIEIDHYPSDGAVLEAVATSPAGWIAEANPWQIPAALAKEADVIVFLDYDNTVNYVRLLRRGWREWRAQGFSRVGFKQIMLGRTVLDLGRIVYRYGRANRRGWRETGLLEGIDTSATVYIRCISPAELEVLHALAANEMSKRASTGEFFS